MSAFNILDKTQFPPLNVAPPPLNGAQQTASAVVVQQEPEPRKPSATPTRNPSPNPSRNPSLNPSRKPCGPHADGTCVCGIVQCIFGAKCNPKGRRVCGFCHFKSGKAAAPARAQLTNCTYPQGECPFVFRNTDGKGNGGCNGFHPNLALEISAAISAEIKRLVQEGSHTSRQLHVCTASASFCCRHEEHSGTRSSCTLEKFFSLSAEEQLELIRKGTGRFHFLTEDQMSKSNQDWNLSGGKTGSDCLRIAASAQAEAAEARAALEKAATKLEHTAKAGMKIAQEERKNVIQILKDNEHLYADNAHLQEANAQLLAQLACCQPVFYPHPTW
jgi:hypothetical protein